MSVLAATSARRARSDGATALLIGALLLGLATATAVAVHVEGAETVRAWLGFTFPEVPRRLDQVLAILATNLRLLGAVLIACLVVRLTRDAGSMRPLVLLCDVALLVSATTHALLIGAGVAAHGGRMIVALLPHGPLELGAFSLALALYVDARRGILQPSRCAVVGAACALLLAVAAPIEVYLVP